VLFNATLSTCPIVPQLRQQNYWN